MKQNIILPLNSKYVLIHRHTRIHTYIHTENTEMMQVQIPSVDAVGAAADTLPFTLIFRSVFSGCLFYSWKTKKIFVKAKMKMARE